jgi:hypothetical protein
MPGISGRFGRQSTIVSCLILVLLSFSSAHAAQTDIIGPAGSANFGTSVTVLPNGNFVVTDPNYTDPANPGVTNIGAVYLYDGATLTIIGTLKGSSANDRIGGGITVLTNGNFIVRSSGWDNPSPVIANVGAVTWCSATVGCNGVVSAANSVIGGSTNDQVGSTSVVVLSNGNYVVRSPNWDNPAGPITDVGAATWASGTGGTVGVITSSNSLIGTSAFDNIGGAAAAELTNGNYVIGSPSWDNPSGTVIDAGAVTWGNGTGGTVGQVTSSNSLVGTSQNDQVGPFALLTNGNYVAYAPGWDNPSGPKDVGAATWCNGAGGTVGPISSANSMIGGTASDQVAFDVVPLTNGNYVIRSSFWANPAGPVGAVGAATWGNGLGGTVGLVSASNSLIGSRANDLVAGSGIVPLSDGNYVVSSYAWDNPAGPVIDVGAVTWCNGAAGRTGLVSVANSLVGGTAGDEVGNGWVTPLTDGNYVISSYHWSNPAGPTATVGAVTWVHGRVPATGLITAASSLIGATAGDQVGYVGTTPLTNGNYVVGSPYWDNPAGSIADAGAVTWGNGAAGTVGVVSSSNSLVGGSANDNVGGAPGAYGPANGITALTNGNYVVTSSFWDDPSPAKTNVGAVTWGNGAGGTVGLVSSSNSLIGGTANDNVGGLPSSFITNRVTALVSGHYMVDSYNWDNPSGPIANAGAVTFGNGIGGTVGLISSSNSLLGTVTNGISSVTPSSPYSYDPVRNRLFVGRGASKIVSILSFTTTAVADGNIDNAGTWDNGVPTALTNVVIPSPRNVNINVNSTIGSLDIAGGATLTMNAALNLTGRLALGTQINTGANVLSLSCSSTVAGASSTNYVIGNLKKDFCAATSEFIYPRNPNTSLSGGAATGVFSFPTGTANGYSPVEVTVTDGVKNTNLNTFVYPPYINTASPVVKANQGPQPAQNPALSLQRYWTLSGGAGITADLKFNYLQSDVMGNESIYQLFKVVNGITQRFPHNPPSVVIDTTTNTAFIRGVSSFSDWTLGEPGAPTAVAKGVVRGRVATSNGTGVEGTVIRLSGSQTRKTITNANGDYRFEDVDSGGPYTVTPSRVNYSFNPFSQTFSLTGNEFEAGFTATLTGSSQNPLDTTEYFVRQQYLDFLGREPDELGFNYWVDNIEICGQDAACRDVRRIDTSAAFFLSIEFHETGYLVYRVYESAYGDIPGTPVPLTRAEFKADTAEIGNGVVVGQAGWQTVLENNKRAYMAAFVQRSRFVTAFPTTMTPAEFVDKLFTNAGVVPSAGDRAAPINEFGSATDTSDLAARGRALRLVAENSVLAQQEYNQAFVLMQYFGYLARDPNSGQDTNFDGYYFWLDKLNTFGGDYRAAEMVRAFLESIEYRGRFTH